jgi:hypothetical protein
MRSRVSFSSQEREGTKEEPERGGEEARKIDPTLILL